VGFARARATVRLASALTSTRSNAGDTGSEHCPSVLEFSFCLRARATSGGQTNCCHVSPSAGGSRMISIEFREALNPEGSIMLWVEQLPYLGDEVIEDTQAVDLIGDVQIAITRQIAE